MNSRENSLQNSKEKININSKHSGGFVKLKHLKGWLLIVKVFKIINFNHICPAKSCVLQGTLLAHTKVNSDILWSVFTFYKSLCVCWYVYKLQKYALLFYCKTIRFLLLLPNISVVLIHYVDF